MEIKIEPEDNLEILENSCNIEPFQIKKEEYHNLNISTYIEDYSPKVFIKSEEIIADIKVECSSDHEGEPIPINESIYTEQPFECDFPGCNYSSFKLQYIRDHQRRHTGEKPFKCEFLGCNLSFSKSCNLTDHKRTHTGERPFLCDFDGCKAAFTRSSSRTKHKRIHTGEKPYKCDFKGCHWTFSVLYSLTNHKLLHTNIRPFKCKKCHATFTQKGSFEVHIKKYHCEKNNECQCQVCNKHKKVKESKLLSAVEIKCEFS